MAEKFQIGRILSLLRTEYKKWQAPVVTFIAQSKTPYHVLISTLLSLRTKDETTAKASFRLFEHAGTPQEMVRLPLSKIESLIYPVGFYRVKAKHILEISQKLIDKYGGRVPDDLDELLKFKGVGRKTANLVLTLGFRKQGICVDVHVHRILNRMGYIKTKTPEETEFKLRDILPKQHWIEINDLLVAFGQTVCRPVSPFCSKCPVQKYCKRNQVTSFR